MAEQGMNCILEVKGTLCGIKTTMCGGYANDGFLLSSNFIIDREGLCALVVPDMENSILKCRNIILYAQFGSKGVRFSMEGSIALSCFSGMEFYVKCELSMTSVSISACSMPTNTYTIPKTPLTICNSGLQIGFDEKGLNFAIMTQINIRSLMWYGALRMSYQGTTVMLDMLSMAMSEVSLAALAENLIGLPRDKVSALDIIAV